MNVDVKKAEGKHVYSLAVLTREFFPYANLSTEEVTKRVASSNITYLIAVHNGATVGFADFELVVETSGRRRCKLMGVAVLEEYRRRGIGSKLVQSVVDEAIKLGSSDIFLLVAEDNEAAISLYHSFGFTFQGKSDKVLNGRQVLVMQKALPTHLNLAC